MVKRVLIPLDGSLLARTALDVATQVVDTTCEIILVTAVQDSELLNYPANPMDFNPEYHPTLEMLEANGKRYLEESADTLRQKGYHVRIKVEVGDAAEAIVCVATHQEVDLIVMSTHGRSGVSRLLFGSVTSRVLSQSTRPVLVVPSQQAQHLRERKLAEMNFN